MTKLSGLPPNTSPVLSDLFVMIQAAGPTDVKVTLQNIINLIGISANAPYKFRAYRNAAANTGNGAFAVIATDTEQFDTNNNLSAGVYTAPASEFYLFGGAVSVSSASADTAIALFKNGAECSRGSQMQQSTSGLAVSDLIQLTAGDTIDLRVYAATTKALNVGSTSQNYIYGIMQSIT